MHSGHELFVTVSFVFLASSAIQWHYDFSPYATVYREQPKSFAHLITRCCAVIGGTYVVFGLLSAVATRLEVAAKKKN